MRKRSVQPVRLFLFSLLALGAVLSVAADASTRYTRPSRGTRFGVQLGVSRSAGVRHYPHHVGHYHRPYYWSFGGPFWYPYPSWYFWGSGGFWLGPAPRTVYIYTKSAPGIVETDVRPKKAEVKLDGVVIGQSRDYNGKWDRLALPAGRYTIAFSAPGYMTLTMELDLEGGSRTRFDQKLQKGEGRDPRSVELAGDAAGDRRPSTDEPRSILATGFVKIRASPADAVIYLDGEFLARAEELSALHGALAVEPGRHVLEVARPGFVTQRVEIDVGAGSPQTIEVELQSE